jgi:hypothetical protein
VPLLETPALIRTARRSGPRSDPPSSFRTRESRTAHRRRALCREIAAGSTPPRVMGRAWLHAFEKTKNKDLTKCRTPLAFGAEPRDEWSCKGTPMTNHPYIFNQSPEQLRRIGARGGKAQARNRRARQQAQAQLLPQQLLPQTLAVIAPLAQTAAQASRVLDARFPWLQGAERRSAPRASHQSSAARTAATMHAL